jgi:quercetin dioxygenase-like cupin family protein
MYQAIVNAAEVNATALDFAGVSIQLLHADNRSGAMTVVTRMEPGAIIPEHWHTTADETVYVLSGDFIEAGVAYGPGTLLAGRAGTSHGPHATKDGCTVLTQFSANLDFQLGEAPPA